MRGAAAQASIASVVNHTVRLPRARRAASYSAQLVTRCRCFGMWRRQAALALNGTAGGPSVREGAVVLHRPAPDANWLIRATRCQMTGHRAARLACGRGKRADGGEAPAGAV